MKEARERLDHLARDLQRVLGNGLVGVYLHGSLALGCFNPALSDVDLLVVTKAGLSPNERDALAPLLAGAGRIEVSFLVEASLTPWRHPAPYDLHFSWPSRLVGPGEDHDLAAHFTVTQNAGIALLGPPPRNVFPEVPWPDYEDSLRRDLAWIRDHGTELYAVLSPARIWATLTERVVHSKASGAAWALERAPQEFRPLLSQALERYSTGTSHRSFEREDVRRFADFVTARLDTDARKPSSNLEGV